MIDLTFAMVIATTFFLAFASSRWIGLLGVALLLYLFPMVIAALLVLAGIAFYLFKLR